MRLHRQKNREIFYRGQRVSVDVEEPSAENAETEVKEIWYRGQRTTVESRKASNQPKKGLRYRGAST